MPCKNSSASATLRINQIFQSQIPRMNTDEGSMNENKGGAQLSAPFVIEWGANFTVDSPK